MKITLITSYSRIAGLRLSKTVVRRGNNTIIERTGVPTLTKSFQRPLLALLFVMVLVHAGAQDYTQAQARIKSIYLYNFIKDVEWPLLVSDGDVKICLLQKTAVFSELEKLAATKAIANRKLSLHQVPSINECASCDLIFIEEKTAGLKRDEQCGSLIVTSGFYDKSISNIVLMFHDNKLQYSINGMLCDKYRMKVSNHLTALANQKLIQP